MEISEYITATYNPVTESMDNSNTNKKYVYEKIIDECGLEPENVLVVGNNFNRDIMPALELECEGVLLLASKRARAQAEEYSYKNTIDLIYELPSLFCLDE